MDEKERKKEIERKRYRNGERAEKEKRMEAKNECKKRGKREEERRKSSQFLEVYV